MPALLRILLSAFLLVLAGSAHAQAWPSRTIKLIVPSGPGLAMDIMGRLLSEKLTLMLGQTVYVENMPGASGLDLAAAVQAIWPDLPIILSSGYLSEELQTRALQMGLRAVLNKEQTVERLPGLLAEIPAGPAAAHA